MRRTFQNTLEGKGQARTAIAREQRRRALLLGRTIFHGLSRFRQHDYFHSFSWWQTQFLNEIVGTGFQRNQADAFLSEEFLEGRVNHAAVPRSPVNGNDTAARQEPS